MILNDYIVYSYIIVGVYGICIMIDLECMYGIIWWGGGFLFCGFVEFRCF